jgi:hypothetical protein
MPAVVSVMDHLPASHEADGLTPERDDWFTTFPQREIADAASELREAIDAGGRTVVGVNRYAEGNEQATEILRIDPALEVKQIARVKAARADRDTAVVESVLIAIRVAAAYPDGTLGRRRPPCTSPRRRSSTPAAGVGDYREQPVFLSNACQQSRRLGRQGSHARSKANHGTQRTSAWLRCPGARVARRAGAILPSSQLVPARPVR